jgi:copper chaperone CopZ
LNRYVFTVRGMSCGMCEAHINDAVRRFPGVRNAVSSRKKNETSVVAEDLDTEAVMREIRALGYDADGVQVLPYEKRALFGRVKKP